MPSAHSATLSGVLLASQRERMAGSSRWSARQSCAIESRTTPQARSASAGVASRMIIAFPSYVGECNAFPALVPLALHPVLEHLQRRCAVVVRRLGESAVVALLDPDLVRTGAVARQRQK